MQERDLDADWNIREHAQVHFRSLDDFLGRRELLCTQPDAVALDPDPPFAVRERRALCRASNRYGYPAFMTLDVFDLTRSQLVALAGEDVQESSMALGVPKVLHEAQRLGEYGEHGFRSNDRSIHSGEFSQSRSADYGDNGHRTQLSS